MTASIVGSWIMCAPCRPASQALPVNPSASRRHSPHSSNRSKEPKVGVTLAQLAVIGERLMIWHVPEGPPCRNLRPAMRSRFGSAVGHDKTH